MDAYLNIVTRLRNHCCSETAKMHFVFLPHYLIKGTIFGKNVTAQETLCLDFLYTFRLKHSSFSEDFRGTS